MSINWQNLCVLFHKIYINRQYLYYVGGYASVSGDIPQSSLFFMDLAAKQLGWVRQTGKMVPPGLKGTVLSSYALEARKFYFYRETCKVNHTSYCLINYMQMSIYDGMYI